jgi:hypothetical protein
VTASFATIQSPNPESHPTRNPLATLGTRVNEFYKKGCQEKSSASTGGDSFSRSSPLWFVIPEEVWRVVSFS